MDLEEQIQLISLIKKKLNPRGAKLISLMISGSDLYGFSSKDSDIDFRGFFMLNANYFLGLKKPKETIELKIGKYDIVLQEIGKGIKLAMNGNGNILEHIFSKQIYSDSIFLDMKELIVLNKCGIYDSYKGLAIQNYKKFILTGRKKTVKKYLYVFRGLMAGIYALKMEKIEPNLEILNQHFKNPHVKLLIKLKKEGKEKDPLPSSLADTGLIEDSIKRYFEKIAKVYTKTNLRIPKEEDWKEIDSFLIKTRKKYLDKF